MKQSIKLLLAFTAIVGSFTSCLKGDTLIHPNNTVDGIVEFFNNTPITTGTSAIFPVYTPATVDPVPSAEFEVTVNYASPNPAPQDIVVQIAADPTAVAAYNAAHSAAYNTLAASSYTLPSTVTIPKGENKVTFKVGLKPNTFDASKENALPLKITSASIGTISGNFGTAIFSLPLKSIWQGLYTMTTQNNYGTLDANIGTAPKTQTKVALTTVGPNRLRVNLVALTYSGFVDYQFSGDNRTITSVAGTSGTPRVSTIDEIIIVDPINKIFELRWTFLGRGLRERFVMEK
jgi:hypothetical protein